MSALRVIIISLFLSVFGATSVPAQWVTQDGIAFDDAKHRGWYVRFWTGSCRELSAICLSGAPYWSEIMQRLLVNVPDSRREILRTRLVLLGQRIGYEWAKENDVIMNPKTPEQAVALVARQRAFFEQWKKYLVTG